MLGREAKGRNEPIVITCDECGTSMPTGSNVLKTALAYAREKGWRVVYRSEVWVHICAACPPKP